MVRIGNFLFHYRNALFPLVYLLLVFKSRPLANHYLLCVVIGFVVACTGQLLRAVTIGLEYIVRGGRNRQVYAEDLVQGGMFAHCRNPLYAGNFLILLGIGIAADSVLFVAVAIPFFIFAYAAIIAAEENYLRNKFGEKFDSYCARVNRLLPSLSGIAQTFAGMRFNWRRLVTAEYGSTFSWLGAMILVTQKNLWLRGQYKTDPALVWALWSCFIVLLLAYGTARFLKKSGLLDDRVTSAS